MQPPQGISMEIIQEAIARRAQGGSTPPVQQMSQPQGQLPTGGQPMPQPNQPPPVQPTATNVLPGSPVSKEGNVVGQLKQGATFDDETKKAAKALVAKLIGVL